ncbi:glycosyltransferase family 4 protein [Infirmifilum sp. NZ]|uniref:glycosyltransferase family 4 protein n=1 Tax=Infirmifilum sp. NZ TaxID=2926850 RepID=UPI0027A3E82F|nr:glycosyltransferase family 4 protein [Infirmifilum sp. NZ]UNQ73122.1 glycosyltransferase family 4 protein [Infirmifilum sp. NZ]
MDAVLSWHETWDSLWLANRIASEEGNPSIAILQLPAFYALKHRVRALKVATRVYYDCLYGGIREEIRKTLAQAFQSFSDELYERRVKSVLNNYTLVLGISKAVCLEMGLEKSNRVFYMDPGVTLDKEDLMRIRGIREGFTEKKDYLIFGGRPSVTKGVVEALLAFRKIARSFNNYRLIITGNIPSREAARLRKFAGRLGIGDKVLFAGFVSREERLRLVREAKLMLYPSHQDAFPYAVAESLLLGTPIVGYDIPALSTYYGKLEGVRLVRELDVDAMADEATDLLSASRVSVEAPRLRPWNEIIQEEVNLIMHAIDN